MAGTGLFAALTHRQYRLLFGGQLLSGFGDWIDFVALVSLVAYQWHQGAAGLAAVSAAAAAPWIVLAPLAGVWADRLPQKRTLIGCDLLRAALVLCYPLAPNLLVLLVLAVAKVSVSTLFAPAQQSTLTLVVPRDSLLAANSLSGFATQLCKVAGPAVGGALLVVTSPGGAFVVDAASFLASALVLSRLRLPAREPATRASRKGRFGRELREGITFVLGNRLLLVAVGSLSATVFLVLAFDTLSPLVLVQLGLPHGMYGPAIAAVAVGAVAGTAVMGQWGQRWNAFTVLALSQAATGLLIALVGAAAVTGFRAAAGFWAPVAVGIGLCSTGILVVFLYLVQRATPQELMGRVSTVVNVVPMVLQLSAPVVGAALAVWVGLGWVLAGAGLGLAVLGVLFLWRPPAGAATPDEPAAAGSTDDARSGRLFGSGKRSRKKAVMAFDSIEALAASGHGFEGATEDQLAVIANLSPEEVAVINSIKAKLDGEVTAHSQDESTVGGLVW
ncbi:MFS transporter [Kitasatospora azatica]|uniref:MFS transporter n=1 Tax=Kitasatospora azatica TaxID=58347 RepID=UPI00056826DC|nr:MFS transporter [Kitasatospora azatica]